MGRKKNSGAVQYVANGRNIPSGRVYIQATFNNTIITFHRFHGQRGVLAQRRPKL